MILLNVTIRCDHPDCGAEGQTTLEPASNPSPGGFPWKPPVIPGWKLPGMNDRYDATCYCPAHAGLPVPPA